MSALSKPSIRSFISQPHFLIQGLPRQRPVHTTLLWSRSTSNMARISPFSKTVVSSMRSLYPECLADKSFDNTGLLLEAPIPPQRTRNANSVLLTIDLTKAVVDEAIEENHSVVVAYHPIIFRGLKAITLEDTQQSSLLRLASHGITVYSPHTAVDIVPGGMADWLCDIVTGKIEPSPEPQAFSADPRERPNTEPRSPPSEVEVTTSEEETDTDTETGTEEQKSVSSSTPKKSQTDPFVSADSSMQNPTTKPQRPTTTFHRTYSKPSYPSRRTPSPIQSSPTTTFHPSTIPHTRNVITPSPSSAIDAANAACESTDATTSYSSSSTGAGRLITFEKPQPLSTLITRIAHATGQPKGFPVAIPQGTPLESIQIRTVGVCPGSGSSVIRGVQGFPPDLIFTGEMSHHEALAVIERGGCVINLFHSNSERGYLEAVMRERLENDVKRRWTNRERSQTKDKDGIVGEILNDDAVRVVVSQRDRDPFGIVVLQESLVEGIKV